MECKGVGLEFCCPILVIFTITLDYGVFCFFSASAYIQEGLVIKADTTPTVIITLLAIDIR